MPRSGCLVGRSSMAIQAPHWSVGNTEVLQVCISVPLIEIQYMSRGGKIATFRRDKSRLGLGADTAGQGDDLFGSNALFTVTNESSPRINHVAEWEATFPQRPCRGCREGGVPSPCRKHPSSSQGTLCSKTL